MNTDQVIDLLTMMASYDRRTVGESDVVAWSAAVGDLPFADARDAVIAYYQDSREWMMPADVRRIAKQARARRIANTPIPTPPAWLDPDDVHAYLAWRQQTQQAIADGTLEHTEEPELPKRDMRAIGGTFKALS